ncbi:hypothetical protein Tco_0674466 [Tanacetum coccineum]
MKEDGSKQAELTIRMRKKYSKGCLGNSRTMGQLPTNWLAMKVNTVKPIVNNARPKSDFYKSVSPFRKSLNRTTTLRTKFSYQKVNTAEVNAVSAVRGKRKTAIKPLAASLNGDERVLNSPCFMVKSWLVQDQTVLGKDYSNLLIADSLLKTIWFINAPCYGNEALAIYSPKAFGQIKILPPKSAEEILARERERKARTTLLIGSSRRSFSTISNISDVKKCGDASKTRFGGMLKIQGTKEDNVIRTVQAQTHRFLQQKECMCTPLDTEGIYMPLEPDIVE